MLTALRPSSGSTAGIRQTFGATGYAPGSVQSATLGGCGTRSLPFEFGYGGNACESNAGTAGLGRRVCTVTEPALHRPRTRPTQPLPCDGVSRVVRTGWITSS